MDTIIVKQNSSIFQLNFVSRKFINCCVFELSIAESLFHKTDFLKIVLFSILPFCFMYRNKKL